MAIKTDTTEKSGVLLGNYHHTHIHDDKRDICVHREGRTREEAEQRGWDSFADKASGGGGSGGGSGK